MANTAPPVNQKEIFGHPAGLYILFFTELWERFSYYGMRALFTLYLVAETTSDNPGFGWTNTEALELYGWYTMLVYVSSIPGGWVADKLLGQKKTVLIGGILLCIGHGILSFESETSFYIGCLFIILGVGGLKPNISSMVGGLYKQGDERRDLGFYIFYMGINIGGFLAPIACGFLAEYYGWHWGFGLAAIGMLLGQVVYMLGQKHLSHVGNLISRKNETDRAILDKPLTSIEKDRVKVLLISFLLIILFWAAFEQAGGLMNLYASEKVDRNLLGIEIPASVFQSVNSFFIITLATLVGSFWYKWKKKGKESSSIFKMAIGLIIMALGFGFMSAASIQYQETGSSGMYWLILAYLFHTIGELCASPVSLSFITKLAPLKYASIIMGMYWAATGLGNKVAGLIGQFAQDLGEFEIFTGILVIWTIIGLLVIAMLKPLKRLTHGAEDAKMEEGIPQETTIE
ncbi:MAG: MFS transporter [Zunongwangia sp.]|jgi:POT family proton-dependent oligopeptide transporter|uniref:POT family amino acid/peptide transporter n=2 Tax=Zunongwangia profunda TaxID=398743 RepID=D5BFQ9_ZUNPS|nr:peptide MFS transporter [Zunongwangia profunda]MAC63571.1 MFS transporter [Flavobacteriaceae bacterium]MAO34932.1 MFS transporter [Zunongwangia sp.]ADF51003.1 POT family amino acid/peptide transporter [Zunongwangia profunda SM-A87]MAG87434.1 MFS transporter [Flavobacteriaceae bacterium]MAS72563.1 MFS transporter [Zunongwangia sp.]|tara:strand:+ start:1040 stop:2416 length:1377 start_codon:yes stop_codon:yes gene_type:complete